MVLKREVCLNTLIYKKIIDLTNFDCLNLESYFDLSLAEIRSTLKNLLKRFFLEKKLVNYDVKRHENNKS